MNTAPTIALCIGHSRRINGRRDGGAVSTGGMQEWDYNQDLAMRLAAILTADGRTRPVIFDEYQGPGYGGAMSWLAQAAAKAGAILAVELHFNSADNPEARGFEFLHWKSSEAGRRLAQAFIDSMTAHFPQSHSRGVKPIAKGERGWHFLAMTECPAVILEPFFGSNASEWARFSHLADELAQAYADAILAHLFP